MLSTFLRNSLKRLILKKPIVCELEKSLYRTIHCILLDYGFFYVKGMFTKCKVLY